MNILGHELTDRFQRRIEYLRISVTDRCNLRCTYCMPPQGVEAKRHDQILSLEEMARVAGAAVKLGVTKVRLTGGEPLVRKGILDLVRSIGAMEGVRDLGITTNGVLLGTMAGPLAEAGLRRVNVSLDTLREDRFHTLTRGGKLATVWEGIDASLEAGLTPVKLNTIIMRSFNFDEIPALAAVTRERPLHLRFIELMEVGETRGWAKSERVSGQEVKDILEDRFGALEAVGRGGECGLAPGCGPALYYRLPGGEGTIGFIDPSSTGFCDRCNRLRLTADGRLKPCLLAAGEIDVRAPLRAGISDEDLRDLVSQAVQLKPPHQEESPTAYGTRKMFQIGG